MKKIIFLFFLIPVLMYGNINGVDISTIFKEGKEESKIWTLVENLEISVIIEEILSSEKLSKREQDFLENKNKKFKKAYIDNFESYYNKEKAEEILNREPGKYFLEKSVLNRVIQEGKKAVESKIELNKEEKEDTNYIFYKNYIEELRRLIRLFPKITSEIDVLSDREKQGFDLNKRTAVLTFDDGPCENTKRLLGYLEKESVKAVFFVQGSNIDNKAEGINILKDEIEAGHEIGIHSLTHIRLKNLNSKNVNREIVYPKEIVQKLTGYIPKFYRTPFGLRDKEALNEIEKRYTANVLWNIDSQDWRSNFTEEMVEERVLKLIHLYNGGIILFHDTNKKSTSIMPEILKKIRENGFEFKTLSEVYGK